MSGSGIKNCCRQVPSLIGNNSLVALSLKPHPRTFMKLADIGPRVWQRYLIVHKFCNCSSHPALIDHKLLITAVSANQVPLVECVSVLHYLQAGIFRNLWTAPGATGFGIFPRFYGCITVIENIMDILVHKNWI